MAKVRVGEEQDMRDKDGGFGWLLFQADLLPPSPLHEVRNGLQVIAMATDVGESE